MFTTAKNITLAAATTIALMGSAAYASEMPDVYEIKVSASYDSAVDTNAKMMFPEITDDIKLAIASRVPLSDSSADPIIRVDIRKVALDGDTILPDSTEFNQLEGIVAIDTNAGGRTFPVKISAETADTVVPTGYAVTAPEREAFYQAMVSAFADNVADGLAKVNY